MYKDKCAECKKDINMPSKSDDEYKASGVYCQCIKNPICFECNAKHKDQHNRNCAFGFPQVGDWFYPK